MTSRPKPYVGVTGFMTPQDVHEALRAFPSAEYFDLMVGVLVSHKSLKGNFDRIRWPNRYPQLDEVGQLFTEKPQALNLIHFNTRARGNRLLAELKAMVVLGNPHMHGLQLNIVWPELAVLRTFHALHPELRIVQQLNRGMLPNKEHGWTIPNMIERLRPYVEEGLITDVLVDSSGGTGKGFSFQSAFDVIHALDTAFPNLGIGIAGGLSAETVKNLEVLLPVFPFLSIDAEGRLRDAEDHLDLARVVAYLEAFHESFTTCDPFSR
jgi:hypothetical protein